ncbi:hypothetical protein [Streptomyces xylophagus]|uniref:hypothetical protein n=1 Tax=Streptomyces xylophagus TaxID=285514 RepID=UPI0018FE9AB4|nr:hypothetical protein [Streptomyces xylophagus]
MDLPQLGLGRRALVHHEAPPHRAGPDGQQPAGEKRAPHTGERQDQSAECGARRDTGVG